MLNRDEVEASFEAVPAYIVADKTDKFGHRLGQAAFVLLLLFFVISSYIQSARNGAQLDEARRQRATLVQSQERISRTVQGQGELIVALQEVITRQNTALRNAGLPVEPVPNLQDLINKAMGNEPTPRMGPTPSPRFTSRPHSSPSPSPSIGPKPRASPSSSPKAQPSSSSSANRNPVTQLVCDTTGVCLPVKIGVTWQRTQLTWS